MEFILSHQRASEKDNIYEDETSCSRGMCPHPSCWSSHVREKRGFRRYISVKPDTMNKTVEQEEDTGSSHLITYEIIM